MTDSAAEQAVAAIVERDHLRLSPEEYERLVRIYAELQPQLAALRLPEIRDREPAVIYPSRA
ncbi:MAG: hypothetical protein E6I52_22725 [Chloroflexi bacterium]|nr:MAG: hypothetical protein E6I52_22725 [Chloroflexota bacterium]